MKNKKNNERINFILNHLTQKEKDEFLSEILNASLLEKKVLEIILAWEATAEINANPSLKRKILLRAKKLDRFLLQRNA